MCTRSLRVDSNTSASRELLRLMKVPIDTYDNTLTILQLEHYPRIFELFDFTGRKALSVYLVQAVVEKESYVPSADEV